MYQEFANLKTTIKTSTYIRIFYPSSPQCTNRFDAVSNVILNGTMEVQTEEPFSTLEGKEINVLPWRVLGMDSQGGSPLGDIYMKNNPEIETYGIVRQKYPDSAFPAVLKASVFQTLEIPEIGTLRNRNPVDIEAEIDEIPPLAVAAAHSSDAALYDDRGLARAFVAGRTIALIEEA